MSVVLVAVSLATVPMARGHDRTGAAHIAAASGMSEDGAASAESELLAERGAPVATGVAAIDCTDCDQAVLACSVACAVLLAASALAALAMTGAPPPGVPRRRLPLVASGIFHPPRPA